MGSTFFDDDGTLCCDECENPVDDCTCVCRDCGDLLLDCACDETD